MSAKTEAPVVSDDRRLTEMQRLIRDRNAALPKHLRRSIDQYRQALGMVPLWDWPQQRLA